jgi:prophage regulatory protein
MSRSAKPDEVQMAGPSPTVPLSDGQRGLRLLRLTELRGRVGLGRSTIYRRIGEGTFPAPKSLGGRAVAWLESDVEAWIAGLATRGDG